MSLRRRRFVVEVVENALSCVGNRRCGTSPAPPGRTAAPGRTLDRHSQGQVRYVIPHYPHPEYELPEAQQESDSLKNEFAATAVIPHGGPVRQLLKGPGAFDLLHFASKPETESERPDTKV
jgi:hypothetical protein